MSSSSAGTPTWPGTSSSLPRRNSSRDCRPNKAGRLYQITKGSRNGLLIRDYTVTLTATEPKGAKKVELEENDSFDLALPGKAKPLKLTFRSISPGGDVVLECTQAKATWELVLPAPPK